MFCQQFPPPYVPCRVSNAVCMVLRAAQIHQDTATPPGKHVGTWLCSDEPLACNLYARPLADGTVLVALLNTGAKDHRITFPFE
jgi:hypothetical protein